VRRISVAGLVLVSVGALVLALVPGALAGGGRGGSKGGCTPKAPYVKVDNTWAWGQTGSFGLPAQSLTYGIQVVNYDVGCGPTSFVVGVAAPSGFSVSMPANTVSLKSAASGYLWATVTSPSAIVDGDYPLTVTVQRAGSPPAASFASYYKVYSSDTVAPTLYWPSPSDGATVSGRSYNVAVSSNDDHAVKTIALSIDGVSKTVTTCAGVSYSCQLNYSWSTSRGQHTATFTSTDWMGNASVMTSTFTVG